MKKTIILLICAAAALSIAACSKQEADKTSGEAKEASIDATSKTTWSYYSLVDAKIAGTGEETEADNGAWAARTDWDIAVCRYNVRTNSGAATSVGAKGGVYVSSESFDALKKLPEGIKFEEDVVVTSTGMGGTTSVVHSTATVIEFQRNEDGSMVMPPVYLKAPVYIFRSADGKKCFKLEFTQYQDENKESGHVKFRFALL